MYSREFDVCLKSQIVVADYIDDKAVKVECVRCSTDTAALITAPIDGGASTGSPSASTEGPASATTTVGEFVGSTGEPGGANETVVLGLVDALGASTEAPSRTTPSGSNETTTAFPEQPKDPNAIWPDEYPPKGIPQTELRPRDLPACADNLPFLKTRHNQTQWCASNAASRTRARASPADPLQPACPVSHMCVTVESKASPGTFLGHCCPKTDRPTSDTDRATMTAVWNKEVSVCTKVSFEIVDPDKAGVSYDGAKERHYPNVTSTQECALACYK